MEDSGGRYESKGGESSHGDALSPHTHGGSHGGAGDDSVSKSQVRSGESAHASRKFEPNCAVKTEIESKPEQGQMLDESMDEHRREQQEEEDTVIHEIDVLFNPCVDVNTKVYVFQYPLRPYWRPYGMDERCEEVRVKPATLEMEADLSIDVNSKNYDKERGIQMTRQTIATAWKPSLPRETRYAIGVLVGDKLHLNPVHAVIQFRPSLQHFSPSSKKKHIVRANEEGSAKSSKEESAAPSRKQTKGMETSAEKITVNEESWVPLKFHGRQSDLSSQYLQKMMAEEGHSIGFSLSQSDYLKSMCPGEGFRNLKPTAPSKRILLSMSLEERIKKVLCEGPLHRFSSIKHFAPEDSAEDVLRVLQQDALLVQGLWTPKTKLLNLDPALSFARDYVLVLFNRSTTITYSQVDAAGRNRDRVKEILSTLAIERPLLNDWKLKEDTDVAFLKCYPEIVKKQEENLQNMEDKVMALIRGAKGAATNRKDVRTRSDITIKSEKPMDSDKRVAKSATVSRVRRTMSEATRRALPEALKEVFQTHKVCSFQVVCQALRDLAVSKCNKPKVDPTLEVIAAYGVDAPPEELKEVISEVATNIHGFYVSKSSLDHPEYDPLRKVVIDLLCGNGPDAKLKKAEVFEAGRSVLGWEISVNEYNKVMSELCESRGSAWVLRKPK